MASEYTWLEDFRSAQTHKPFDAHDLLPAGFDQYFLIESNYGIIEDFPFEAYPEDKSSIEHLNKQHAIEREFGLFLKRGTEHLFTPISIKNLANRFNVPYSVETLNHIKHTPGIAYLPIKTKAIITELVSVLAGEAMLNFYVADDLRSVLWDFQMDRENRVSASDYLKFQDETGFDYCTYLFPDGRPWCLVTMADYPYLFLGCDDASAKQLFAVKDLEFFPVKW